jgi:multisubunit Na+/H+ antiporter MnhC subunit
MAYPRNGTVLTSNDVTLDFNVPALTQFTYENVTAQITSVHCRVEALKDFGLGWNTFLEEDVTPKAGYSYVALSLPDGNFSVTITVVWAGIYQPRGTFAYAEGFSVENSSNVYFAVDMRPPNITILSPLNKNYNTTDIPLSFIVNEPVSETAYSLDGQANVTLTGNKTVKGLSVGTHSLIVYATDMAGNTASKTVQFSVTQETQQLEPERQPSEPFPTTLVATALAVSVAVVGLGLLFYFEKRKHQVD